MPPDDIDEATLKQLHKLRVRGAPAIRPGMRQLRRRLRLQGRAAPVGSHAAARLGRGRGPDARHDQATRSRASSPQRPPRTSRRWANRCGCSSPTRTSSSHPNAPTPPSSPFVARPRTTGDVKVSRLEGGFHISTTTDRGLPDLEYLYTYLFGKVSPVQEPRPGEARHTSQDRGRQGRRHRRWPRTAICSSRCWFPRASR